MHELHDVRLYQKWMSCHKMSYAPERMTIEGYKRDFIELLNDSEVVRFGEFTLKSGRRSP